VFWLLLGAIVLLSLVVLGATLLLLWRRLKVLGAEVAAAGATVGEIGTAVSDVQSGRTPDRCPTCGGPTRAATSGLPGVRR
jgi:hypothetical protein